MGDDGLEVLHADANMEPLLHCKLFKVQAINGNGRLERLSENFWRSLNGC